MPQAATGGPTGTPPETSGNPPIGPLFSPPFSGDHLLADWDGARPWLQDRGIDVLLNYLQESFGNPSGGLRQGATYTSEIGLAVDLDFGKLAGLPGLAMHGVVVQGSGRSLSNVFIGDHVDQVQQIFGGRGDVLAHLVYLYAEQSTADNRFDIAGGWMPVGTYFATSPLYCAFVNAITCGNPYPLPVYAGEPAWPSATLGGQVRVLPTPQSYLMAGAFAAKPTFGGPSGWNMSLADATGASIPVEIGWVPTFGPNHLVGHYKFGFDLDTSPYPDLFYDGAGTPLAESGLPGASRHGRRMYYVLLDQMLARTGESDTDGLIAFGGWVHADADVSPLENQFFAGLINTGAAFGRKRDSYGIMWNWFAMSSALTRTQELQTALGLPLTTGGLGAAQGIQSREQTLELMYTAQVHRGISVEPDIQYIIRPGATAAIRNAVAIGVQTDVNF